MDYLYSIPKEVIGPTLIELADSNEKIVVLSSDVSVSCNVEVFNKKYPNRFFEMGIAEQSTMSVAGGMAIEGFQPFYVALSIFSMGMTWAQTRQICNENLNVRIIGTHAGVDDGQDGSGHHATEDIAISRVLPRMAVLTPSDENEVVSAIHAMEKIRGPVYMRVARESQPIIHKKGCVFEVGKSEYLFDKGNDFAIIYEGSALKQALDGWELLCRQGFCGKLISIRTVKPIDRECLWKVSKEVPVIITVENHSMIGGLYSAVSEQLACMPIKKDVTVVPVGFQDLFMESGASDDIKRKYGLTGEAILQTYLKCME